MCQSFVGNSIFLVLLTARKDKVLVKIKFHKKIAFFLLGCMLIISMPFHDFLHQHSHIQERDTQTHCKQEQLHNLENIVDFHDCIACVISQAAQTLFLKNSFSLPTFLAYKPSFLQVTFGQSLVFIFTTNGRAPPFLN